MLRSTKPPKCKWCKERTDRIGKPLHDECMVPWVEAWAAKQKAKKERQAEAAKKRERAQDRAKKESLKRYWTLVGEAQDAFNAFIRERDKDAGCFVCGEPFPFTEGSLGGVMDAGHVRTRAAAPHLRFNEDNCHGECKHCNGSFGAKPHEIEAGAIRRIGQERYNALAQDNTTRKWTRDDLRAIRDTYRRRLKELKAKEKA